MNKEITFPEAGGEKRQVSIPEGLRILHAELDDNCVEMILAPMPLGCSLFSIWGNDNVRFDIVGAIFVQVSSSGRKREAPCKYCYKEESSRTIYGNRPVVDARPNVEKRGGKSFHFRDDEEGAKFIVTPSQEK